MITDDITGHFTKYLSRKILTVKMSIRNRERYFGYSNFVFFESFLKNINMFQSGPTCKDIVPPVQVRVTSKLLTDM